MNGAEAIEIGREALLTMLIVPGPICGHCLLTATIDFAVSALTQLREMTLVFIAQNSGHLRRPGDLRAVYVEHACGILRDLTDRIVGLDCGRRGTRRQIYLSSNFSPAKFLSSR